MTKHTHHKHCEHEEVAYCGHCQVVYCKGCNREWSDCKLAHYPYVYYPTPSVYPYTCGICNCTPCLCPMTVTWGTSGTTTETTAPTGITLTGNDHAYVSHVSCQ